MMCCLEFSFAAVYDENASRRSFWWNWRRSFFRKRYEVGAELGGGSGLGQIELLVHFCRPNDEVMTSLYRHRCTSRSS